jgi:hypothetical protein
MDAVSTILSQAGISANSVKEIHALQIGCLPFAFAHDGRSIFEEIESFDAYARIEERLESLRMSPDVSHVRVIQDEHYARTMWSEVGLILSSTETAMRVRIPQNRQKLSRRHLAQYAPTSFDVVMAGSWFCASTRVSDIDVPTLLGNEFRIFATETFSFSPTAKPTVIGPSPVHPRVFAVRISDLSLDGPAPILSHSGDVVVPIPLDADLDQFVCWVLLETRAAFGSFYQAMAARVTRMDRESEIYSRFARLSRMMRVRLKIPWWDIARVKKLVVSADRTLSETYERFFALQMLTTKYVDARRACLADVSESSVLRSVKSYFDEHLELPSDPPNVLLPALEHYGEQVRSSGNARIAAGAALFSAVIASILTALLSR